LEIHEVLRNYTPSGHPVYVIVDAQPTELGIPTKAYITVEEISEVIIFIEQVRLQFLI